MTEPMEPGAEVSESIEAAGEDAEPTWLYRIFGDADLLLYIGISKDFGGRWKQHAKEQPWWPEMRRLSADHLYDTRPEAKAAETDAIKAEHPKYNIAENRPEPPEQRVTQAEIALADLWERQAARAGVPLTGQRARLVERIRAAVRDEQQRDATA